MIKCSCRCYCSHNRGMLVLHYQQQKWSKIKKKKYNLKIYNLRDHQNSPIDTVADTGSTVIGSKNLSFWDNWEKIFFSQLLLVFLLRTNWFWFWWVIQKCLEIGKNQKKIIWLLMVTPIIFKVWWASWILWFFFKRFSIKLWIWKSNLFFPSFGCDT